MGNISSPNIVLFMGAGASQPLGLPTTMELSSILQGELSDESRKLWINLNGSKDAEEVIRQINDLLNVKTNIWLFKQFLIEQCENEDIKKIMMEKFKPIYKIISKMDMVVFLDRTMKPIYSWFNLIHGQILNKMPELFKRIENLSQEIYNLIFSVYELSQEKEPEAVSLYKPLLEKVEGYTGDTVLPIFTTNYDGVIPTVLDSLGYDFVDGFRVKRRRRFFDRDVYEENRKGIHVFHLRGAINWRRTRNDRIAWVQTGELVTSSKIYKENVLIPLGSHEYRYEEPFKTGHDYLRKYLESAGKCIVIGYSFRNDPINDIFREASATNEKLTLHRIAPDMRFQEVFPENSNWREYNLKFGDEKMIELIETILKPSHKKSPTKLVKGIVQYFVKNLIVHNYPVPNNCKVKYDGQTLHSSPPSGYEKCDHCWPDLPR